MSVKLLIINKKNFMINSLISFIILSFILLTFYPGIMTYDGNFQWNEVQAGLVTNSHPFLSTYFMHLLSKIHNSPTIVIIYQIILFSLTYGYLCQSLKCDKNQEYIKYIFTIVICLTPLISIYQITLWKDIIYTSYLFCIGIMLFNFSENNYDVSIINYIIFGILCTLVFSYRFNGMVVSILTVLILIIDLFKKYKKQKIPKNALNRATIIFISFVVSLFTVMVLKSIITNETNKKIEKKNKSDEVFLSSIDSYMLWMMSSHLVDENIKNKSDLKFLNNIIPIEEWKVVYNPYLINNTSMTEHLNKQYTIRNSDRFRKIFIKYTKQYPLTIVKHYMKSDSLLLNPISMIKGYVYVFDFSEEKNFYAKTNSKIPFIQRRYTELISLTLKRPFIIFYQPALILYIAIILTIILSKKVYGKKIWMFISPMLFNTISLLPINLAQDLRYAYINYLTFFGILLIFTLNYKRIFISKRNDKIRYID